MELETARAHIGDKVIYDPCDGSPAELGVITSVGQRFVFVRYGADYGTKPTDPDALSLILVADSGAEYILGDPIGLVPEPGTVCDAAEWGGFPSMSPEGGCRCTVCPRCHHHTGNSHQGHYWAHCKVTGTTRDFHLCCPDPAYGCELEHANG